ncbi:MAG: hypothetical protein N4A62_15320 [Marinisporobacter sp.]|jgi:hypothetical protein|nr:hypothetical protein [Marinisporobacter sp.]
MVEFNNYKHFKNYCLKIAHNKEIKLTIQDYEIIDNFEELLNFLAILIEQNRIEYNGDMLNKIADLFKKDEIKNVIYIMDYLTRKLSKFKNGEVDIYYIFTSLRTMLGVDIQFTDEFIRSADTEDIFYPSRLRVLEICEDTDVIYSISINGLNENKIPGVYFIYDNKGVIAYIGKSISCAINRSFSSVIESKLIDFFKIEIRAPKTKSDIAIYEAYYISKFKPYCNNDLVYEDETTLLLPELDVIKSFERDLK